MTNVDAAELHVHFRCRVAAPMRRDVACSGEADTESLRMRGCSCANGATIVEDAKFSYDAMKIKTSSGGVQRACWLHARESRNAVNFTLTHLLTLHAL